MRPEAAASRGRVVEIAGIAGSGKSTLSRILSSQSPHCRLDDTLRLRDPTHLPYVVHSAPRLIRLLANSLAKARAPSWTELKLLVYVMEWDRRLAIQGRAHGGDTLFDQGPVYALARLGYVDRLIPGTEPYGGWWTSLVDTWARALDGVVWLDASNDVLWERVNDRTQSHEIKGKARLTGMAFFDRYRDSYQRVLQSLGAGAGPLVLRYDTSAQGPEEIAFDVRQRLLQPVHGS